MSSFKPLRIRYGPYVHRVNEGNLKISREPRYNHIKQLIGVVERWSWVGRIKFENSTVAAQIKALSDLERAYSVNGRDLVLETIDGQPTYHRLLSSDCVGGTKVSAAIEYPDGRGNEAIAYRTYSITVEGELPAIGRNMIVEFRESISISGGGWRRGVREVNYGPGVQQLIRTHTACQATQSGSMTLYLGTPRVPDPIWPDALVDQHPAVDLPNPTHQRGVLSNQSVSWNYNYVWPFRLIGQPHYPLNF